jgi:hypothetical protein
MYPQGVIDRCLDFAPGEMLAQSIARWSADNVLMINMVVR